MIEDYHLFTYRRLRRAIGYLGIALPVVLVCLSLFSIFNTDIQHTISNYFYTNLRDIFTGTLCAIGFFLFRYKGHGNKLPWKNDNLLTNLAGVMAIGAALVPTNSTDPTNQLIPVELGWLHKTFAAVLFFIFAILSIFVFTIGQKKDRVPLSILNENHIYKICGYSIIIFIILIGVFDRLDVFDYSTLVFEALLLFAFGIAWLVKGRALGDKGKIGEMLYREKNPKNTEE